MAAKGRSNRHFKHGGCSGWTSYRYGETSKPVTLAHAPTVLGKERFEAVGSKVVDLLREWGSNRWENEAPVRYGLRKALVLEGNGWAVSDQQAGELVRRGFNILARGRETRPTKEEGQRHFTDIGERCLWCTGPLNAENGSGNRTRVFCCEDHARLAYARWEMTDASHGSAVEREAYRAVYRQRMPARQCEGCGEPFKPRSEAATTRFCSLTCSARAQRRLIPMRPCAQCGETFQPHVYKPDARFCSQKCNGASRQIHMPKPCVACGTTFIPRTADVQCCSKFCGSKKAASIRIDAVCKCCGTPFIGSARAVHCSPRCGQVSWKVDRGRVRSLSPLVFDYLLHRQGVVIVGAPREPNASEAVFAVLELRALTPTLFDLMLRPSVTRLNKLMCEAA